MEADYQVKHNLELLGSQGSSFMSEVTCLALQFQVTKRPLTKASGSLRGDTQGDEANSGGCYVLTYSASARNHFTGNSRFT